MIAYYGSTVRFDSWDISKTKEFGYHFGLNSSNDSIHRISKSGGYLYEVDISFKNPVRMKDPFFWDLATILTQLGMKDQYPALKNLAVQRSKKNGSSLRSEENLIAAETLDSMGYDAIVYENKAEDGGTVAILWQSQQIHVRSVKQINPTT